MYRYHCAPVLESFLSQVQCHAFLHYKNSPQKRKLTAVHLAHCGTEFDMADGLVSS